MLNKIQFKGEVVHKPIIQTAEDGYSVAVFVVASFLYDQDQDLHIVAVFGDDLIAWVGKNLREGIPVFTEGSLAYMEPQDKNNRLTQRISYIRIEEGKGKVNVLSRSPTLSNLETIASLLKCRVKDLLKTPNHSPKQDPYEAILQKKHSVYARGNLLPEVIKTVEGIIKKHELDLTLEQFLNCVREVYLHSLAHDPMRVDGDFADWFVALLKET